MPVYLLQHYLEPIRNLPANYVEWRQHRDAVLTENLRHSQHTSDLEGAFRRDLGPVRFRLLRQVQALIAPAPVRDMLGLKPARGSSLTLLLFRLLIAGGLRGLVQKALIPPHHLPAVHSLDQFRPA